MARSSRSAEAAEELRQILEQDLYSFAKYINPHYSYGGIHEEVFNWLQTDNRYQLLLMPRGHLKSHCIATWCAWWITKNPHTSIVYLSAGEDLAKAQISAIKGMLTCKEYSKLWPDMIRKEEAKRKKWSAYAIQVDHPRRKLMGTRDDTIIVKTVKANFVGLHCDVMVYDDVVVDTNAYTQIGRDDVRRAVAKCASIKNPGAITKAVGTIYHPKDIYNTFEHAKIPIWDDKKQRFKGKRALWEIKKYELEDRGDLTGQYLWPRVVNPHNGEGYGFDIHVMLEKREEYFSAGENAQFYAQYYNDPNDPDSEKVERGSFEYYEPSKLKFDDGSFYYDGRKLNLVAAMDVAWTENKDSDYTALGVIGIDSDWRIFILGLDRFKTSDFDIYYQRVEAFHKQFGFRVLHVESNAGGLFVAKEIKARFRKAGSTLIIKPKASTGNEGKKEEKHNAILIPRVKNGQVYVRKGGLTDVFIEETVLERPPNDDLKDVVTTAIFNAVPPARDTNKSKVTNIRKYHKKYGGTIRRFR